MKRLSLAAVAAGLLAWAHGPASAALQAGLQPGEGIELATLLAAGEAGVPYSQTDSACYGSTVGMSTGGCAAAGLVTELSPPPLIWTQVLTTTPNSMPAGLVSGGLSLVYGGGGGGQATVSASLATGAIHSYVAGLYAGGLDTDGSTTGILSDGLTWHVAGGGSAAVTISVQVDGTVQNSSLSSFTNQFHLQLGSPIMDFYGNNAGTVATSANPDWVSEAFTNVTMTGFDFTGVLDVTNDSYTPFYMYYLIDPCGYGLICNFLDTAQVSLGLPTGVSYASDSGVFLSSTSTPAPEPGTLGLLAVSAGGVAFARRRRRH